MIEAKRVPYGVSDFLRVIRENQYYVDKTMYIPLLEAQPDYLIFIRPRRFGKSLFLSMLEAYYDCKIKDQFQEIFGASAKLPGALFALHKGGKVGTSILRSGCRNRHDYKLSLSEFGRI